MDTTGALRRAHGPHASRLTSRRSVERDLWGLLRARLGLAPDPLATPLYWSPFSPVPRRGRPNLLRRFFAPGFMGMGGV